MSSSEAERAVSSMSETDQDQDGQFYRTTFSVLDETNRTTPVTNLRQRNTSSDGKY